MGDHVDEAWFKLRFPNSSPAQIADLVTLFAQHDSVFRCETESVLKQKLVQSMRVIEYIASKRGSVTTAVLQALCDTVGAVPQPYKSLKNKNKSQRNGGKSSAASVSRAQVFDRVRRRLSNVVLYSTLPLLLLHSLLPLLPSLYFLLPSLTPVCFYILLTCPSPRYSQVGEKEMADNGSEAVTQRADVWAKYICRSIDFGKEHPGGE